MKNVRDTRVCRRRLRQISKKDIYLKLLIYTMIKMTDLFIQETVRQI